MEKILVLGSTGMAGHLITLYLYEKGYNVTALSITKFPFVNNIICDVTNDSQFSKVIIDGEYDVIINCIGILNQFAEDNKDKAVYLNSYLPHKVCKLIENAKTKYIHMSTDCVFSGDSDFYNENSPRDGKTFYDRTKALGEINDNRNLTFRNSIIGPDTNENGIGLFNWFMKQDKQINGYDGVKWNGVTTLTLAKAMEKAMKTELSGIYNLVNNNTITKFEMLMLFNKYSKKDLIITKTSDFNVSKILNNTRQHEFDFVVPKYDIMIAEMFDWINTHKHLYNHYFKKGAY